MSEAETENLDLLMEGRGLNIHQRKLAKQEYLKLKEQNKELKESRDSWVKKYGKLLAKSTTEKEKIRGVIKEIRLDMLHSIPIPVKNATVAELLQIIKDNGFKLDEITQEK